METPTRAPGYDFFKLIVAIFLLILALILMWASPPQSSTALLITPSVALQPSPTAGPASPTSPPLTATASTIGTNTSEPSATPLPSSTSPPSTATALPVPSPTETSLAEPTATPLPLPTATPMPQATTTPGTAASEAAACNAALARSHLKIGEIAIILRRLNFRSSPGIGDNWILTNLRGTQVKVIGGPQCAPYWKGAYLWWQIELPDGRAGWSAESSLRGTFYFMEPK